jgi:hypothetical protein
MSRWKKLDGWEDRLSEMTTEQLEAELAYWKLRASLLPTKAVKGTLKLVHKVERALQRRRSENEESTQS